MDWFMVSDFTLQEQLARHIRMTLWIWSYIISHIQQIPLLAGVVTFTTLLLVIASYGILLKRPVLDKIKANPSVNYSSSDL